MNFHEFEDFNDAVLLPSQFNGLIRGGSPRFESERRLLWAVLENAVRTYVTNARRATPMQRREFEGARRWFYAKGCGAHDLFAFQSICDLLGIDSEWLLQRLEDLAFGDSPLRGRRNASRNKKLGRSAA